MKALCIPDVVGPGNARAEWAAQQKDEARGWLVLAFDDATAARLAALYQPNPSEGTGLDPDALEAR